MDNESSLQSVVSAVSLPGINGLERAVGIYKEEILAPASRASLNAVGFRLPLGYTFTKLVFFTVLHFETANALILQDMMGSQEPREWTDQAGHAGPSPFPDIANP